MRLQFHDGTGALVVWKVPHLICGCVRWGLSVARASDGLVIGVHVHSAFSACSKQIKQESTHNMEAVLSLFLDGNWGRDSCCLTGILWSDERESLSCDSVSRGNVVASLLPRSRIERGYLKRIRTAGCDACVNIHVDPEEQEHMAVAIEQRNVLRQLQRKAMDTRKHAKTGFDAVLVDTREIGKPDLWTSDEVRRFVFRTEIVPRSRRSAVSRGVDEDRRTSTPRLNAVLGIEDSTHSQQMLHS